jgi:hypothetical protein
MNNTKKFCYIDKSLLKKILSRERTIHIKNSIEIGDSKSVIIFSPLSKVAGTYDIGSGYSSKKTIAYFTWVSAPSLKGFVDQGPML